MQTISQKLKNIAADHEINAIIPKAFTPLEVVAAATSLAREIAGHEEPDRHEYLAAVPVYLEKLPNNVQLALDVVKMDASKILLIPGLATDHALLSDAQRKLADAESEVAAAEALQGRRLASIHRLEDAVVQANQDLEAWDIDFDSWETQCDAVIVESFGKVDRTGRLNAAFAHRDQIPHLRRLGPAAVANLNATIADAQAELHELRAQVVTDTPQQAPQPPALVRGRVKLLETATAD